jgi:hypothetical protein
VTNALSYRDNLGYLQQMDNTAYTMQQAGSSAYRQYACLATSYPTRLVAGFGSLPTNRPTLRSHNP